MISPRPRVGQLVRETVPKDGRRSKLRLDINENVVGWPADVVRQLLASITPTELAAYPETQPLYAAIARHHALTPANVLVASGSELAIRYVFEAYLAPDTELLILDPSFAMFEVYGRLFGADIVKVPFDRRLAVSMDEVMGRMGRRTKIVAVANPNNPTGTVFGTADLVRLVERAAALDCLVLVDEAYFYFHPETVAPRVKDFDNLIVTRTLSKAFGLAGLRLGYALGAAPLIAAVQKVQPIDHANVVAARFGEYAIEHEDIAWTYAREVALGKAYVADALRASGLTVVDTCANFLLVDLGPDRDRIVGALSDRALVGASVRLPFENTYAKLTVGPVDEMKRFVELIRPLVGQRSPA